MSGPVPPAGIGGRPVFPVAPEAGAAEVRVLSVSQALAMPDAREAAARWAGDDPTRSPDWLVAWYAAFARAETAPCILWRHQGRLAGLLPLTAVRRGPLRVLRSPTNGHSQRAPCLCAAGGEAAFAGAAIRGLAGLRGWDVLHLQGLAPEAAEALVTAAAQAGWRAEVLRDFRHLLRDHALPLPERSRATLQRQARQERGLARLGGVECRWAAGAAAGAALQVYFAAERQSWKAAGGELLTATPAIAGFYRALAETSKPETGLEVGLLHAGDRIVAGILLLRQDRRRVALKIFHDEAVARLSPAAFLLRCAAERAAPGVLDLYTGHDAYAPLANAEAGFRDILLWPPRLRAGMFKALRSLRNRVPCKVSSENAGASREWRRPRAISVCGGGSVP